MVLINIGVVSTLKHKNLGGYVLKIWVDDKWYSLPYKVLVVHLEDKDKKNIANMNKDCSLYCEFDESMFNVENIIDLLKKLKKEIENAK